MFHSLTRPLLSALLAACLFFCGCSLFQPDQAPTPTPTASVSPASLPSPSPTPRIGNPVWIFYQDLYDAIDAPLNQLHEALAATPIQGADAAGDSACLDGELLLSALESRLTEGMMTLGLLLRSDSSSDTDPYASYSSSVEGAFQGTGSIQYSGSTAALRFQHTDGKQLSGTLTAYRLRYGATLPDAQAPVYQILILRAPQGWVIRLEESDGQILTLRWDGVTLGLYDMTGAPLESNDQGFLTFHNAVDGYARCWEWGDDALRLEP